MKQAERDELFAAQTEALKGIDARLAALEAGQKRRERASNAVALPSIPPRVFRRLDGLPGWTAKVPEEHVIAGSPTTVRCRCGADTILTMRIPMACTGGCERWFLNTDAGVMWKLLPEAEAA